jgi:hypothetical protein
MARTHAFDEACPCPACQRDREREEERWRERQQRWSERRAEELPEKKPATPPVYETDASGSVHKTCRCGLPFQLFAGGKVTYQVWIRKEVYDPEYDALRLVTMPIFRRLDGCPVCLEQFTLAVIHGREAIPCPKQAAKAAVRRGIARPSGFSARVTRIL